MKDTSPADCALQTIFLYQVNVFKRDPSHILEIFITFVLRFKGLSRMCDPYSHSSIDVSAKHLLEKIMLTGRKPAAKNKCQHASLMREKREL